MSRFSFVALFATLAAPALAQNEPQPLAEPSVECRRVFEEARRLPAPNPASIHDYGRRVVDQGERCLQSGFQSVTRPSGARRAD